MALLNKTNPKYIFHPQTCCMYPFFSMSKNSQGQDLTIIKNSQQKQKAEIKTCKQEKDKNKQAPALKHYVQLTAWQ